MVAQAGHPGLPIVSAAGSRSAVSIAIKPCAAPLRYARRREMSATGSVELHARRRGAVRNGQAPARREGRRVDLQVLVACRSSRMAMGGLLVSRSRPLPCAGSHLDHLIRPLQQRRRDGQVARLPCVDPDHHGCLRPPAARQLREAGQGPRCANRAQPRRNHAGGTRRSLPIRPLLRSRCLSTCRNAARARTRRPCLRRRGPRTV